jgi:hypothetical protein
MPRSDFEKFTRKLIPLGKQPTVTVQKRGNLSLSNSAYVALGSPKAVSLLYNREERIVGLEPADPDDPDAYPPRPVGGRRTGSLLVTAGAFVHHYGIDATIPRRYNATVEDGILTFDLKKPIWTGDEDGRAEQGRGAADPG